MAKSKTVGLLAASAVVALVAITHLLWPDDQNPAFSERQPAEVLTQESSPSLAESQAAHRIREAQKNGELPNLTAIVQSNAPYPHNVSMDQYLEVAWTEIQQAPPRRRSLGDESVTADEAYRLYLYHRICAGAPRTHSQIDHRLEKVEERTGTASLDRLEELEEDADFWYNLYEICSLIPLDVDCHFQAVKWLSAAVRLDHEIAQAKYYYSALETILYYRPGSSSPSLVMLHPELIDEFRQTARYAVERALENGHPEAYLAMSQAVLDGLIYTRDPLMSFAYAHAASLIAPPETEIGTIIEYRKNGAEQFLVPEQISEAENAGRLLILRGDG